MSLQVGSSSGKSYALLNSFVVHDYHDFSVLKRLFQEQRVQRMPTITVTSFDVPRHAISDRHRTPAHVTNLMDVLGCSEKNCGHIIMNHIVDSVRHISIVHTVTIYDTKQPTYQGDQPSFAGTQLQNPLSFPHS